MDPSLRWGDGIRIARVDPVRGPLMQFRSRFILGLAWRLGLLLVAAFAFVQSLYVEGLGAARIVAGLLVAAAAAWLWRHVQRTNMELTRFIDSVRFADFSQGFSHRFDGSGFVEL